MKKIIPLKTALPIIDGLTTDSCTKLIDECVLPDSKYILRDGDGNKANLTIEKTWEKKEICTANQDSCQHFSDGKCHREMCQHRKKEFFNTDLRITLDWAGVGIFEYHDAQGASVRDGLQNIRKQVFDFIFS